MMYVLEEIIHSYTELCLAAFLLDYAYIRNRLTYIRKVLYTVLYKHDVRVLESISSFSDCLKHISPFTMKVIIPLKIPLLFNGINIDV